MAEKQSLDEEQSLGEYVLALWDTPGQIYFGRNNKYIKWGNKVKSISLGPGNKIKLIFKTCIFL